MIILDNCSSTRAIIVDKLNVIQPGISEVYLK